MPQFISEWNTGKYELGVGNNPQITPYDWYATLVRRPARVEPVRYESPELEAAAEAAIEAAGRPTRPRRLWEDVMKIIIDDEALACGFTVGSRDRCWNTATVAGRRAARPSRGSRTWSTTAISRPSAESASARPARRRQQYRR